MNRMQRNPFATVLGTSQIFRTFIILFALIAVNLAPASYASSNAPQRGDPTYNRVHPESYHSIKTQYDSLIEKQAWPTFLQRIKIDHLNETEWTGEKQKKVRKIFVAAIDSFLASYLAATAIASAGSAHLLDSAFSLDSARLPVTAASGNDEADKALVKSKIVRFKTDPIDDIEYLFTFIEHGDSVPIGVHPIGICWLDTTISENDRVRLFLLADAIYGILNDGISIYRKATMYHIHAAATRWKQFTSDITSTQYPWETFLNGFLGPQGDIEHPPTWQWSMLHASPALEIREANLHDPWKPLEDTKVSEALGISLIGVNWYSLDGDGFHQKIGVSAYVSLTDDLDPPGWGVSTKWGKVVQVGYVQRWGDINKGAVVVGVDFWSFLEKKQSAFTRKRTEFLDNSKAAFESLTADPLSILK